MRRYFTWVPAIWILILLILAVSCGKDVFAETTDADRGWEFSVAPYLWLPAMVGDVTVRGNTSSVDLSLGDTAELIVDNFKFAAIGHAEARRDRWMLMFDLVYLSLEAEKDTALRTHTDVEFRQAILELGGGYRLGTWPVGSTGETTVSADVLAGGRYVLLDTELEIDGGGPLGLSVDVGKDVDWFDPFVGLRLWFNFPKGIALMLRGDVGGFDVGSDVAWQAVGAFHFRLSQSATLVAGYRALGMDYDEGSGASRFVFDMQLRGPILGVVYHF